MTHDQRFTGVGSDPELLKRIVAVLRPLRRAGLRSRAMPSDEWYVFVGIAEVRHTYKFFHQSRISGVILTKIENGICLPYFDELSPTKSTRRPSCIGTASSPGVRRFGHLANRNRSQLAIEQCVIARGQGGHCLPE